MENLIAIIKWKRLGWFSWIRGAKGEVHKKRTDYSVSGLSIKEEIQCLLEGLGIVALAAYFFFRSFIAVLLLLPGIWFYRKEKIRRDRKKRKQILEQQFRECLFSVQTNLQSGYSMENAFIESYSYVVNIYGSGSDMAKELTVIQQGLANGNTLENLLRDMGKRCPSSALEEFAEIYSIACRSGGSWKEVIRKIISGISQRIELRQEIETLIHGKKQESRIMCVVPFLILIYMNITNKGYFDVLYHNPAGIAIMTVCLVGYVLAFLVSEKITEI